MSDNLFDCRVNGSAFSLYREGACNSPPSFKVEKKRDYFSYAEDAMPTYSDRILWYSRPGMDTMLSCLSVECTQKVTSSHHKPLTADFAMRLWEPHVVFDDVEELQLYCMRIGNLRAQIDERVLGEEKVDEDSLWVLRFDTSDVFCVENPELWGKCESTIKQGLSPEWHEEDFLLRTTHFLPTSLRTKTIHVFLMKAGEGLEATECAGHGSLALDDFVDKMQEWAESDGSEKEQQSMAFTLPLCLNGIRIGRIDGSGTLNVARSDTLLAAYPQKRNRLKAMAHGSRGGSACSGRSAACGTPSSAPLCGSGRLHHQISAGSNDEHSSKTCSVS